MSTANGKNKEWTVYVLRCPETQAIRYVGVTRKTIERRLGNHLRDSVRFNNLRCNWIRGLKARGLSPIIEAVETTTDWNEAEQRWVAKCKAEGCKLVNGNEGGRTIARDSQNRPLRSVGGIRQYKALWRLLRDCGDAYNWLCKNNPEKAAKIRPVFELGRKRINERLREGKGAWMNRLLIERKYPEYA